MSCHSASVTLSPPEIFDQGAVPLPFVALTAEALALLEATSTLLDAAADYAGELARLGRVQADGGGACLCACAPVSPPSVEDSCHPAGSLRVEGDTVVTAGGYWIEMVGRYEWKITGPDGRTTRVWGDPHVDEGDRDGACDWDFKRDSTFVLGDGTRVNVTTVPGGADGMTVTGSLEIISGNDRVLVSDIDKCKGRIGTVTQDGYQHVNGFRGDVFVMGREADDWSYTGREIVGSLRGGEEFTLGGELHPLDGPPVRYSDGFRWAMTMLHDLFDAWRHNWQPARYEFAPYRDAGDADCDADRGPRAYLEGVAQALRAFALLFDALARVHALDSQLSTARRGERYYMTA